MIAARIRPSPEADLDNATVNESQELESGRVRSDPRLVRFDGPVAFTSVQQQLARRMGQDSRHIHRPLIEDVRGYFRSAYAVGFYHNHDFVDTLRFIGTSFSTKLDSLVHQRLSMAVLWKDAEIPTERFKRIVGALAGTIRGNSSSLELYPLLLLPDEPHWMIRSLFARMNNYAQSSNRLLTTMQMRSNYFGTASERLIPPWFMNDLGVRGTNGWIKRGRRPPRVQPHPLRPRERIEWRDFKVGGDAEREAVATLLAATDLRINGHRVATNLHRFSQLALYYNGQNDVMAALPVLTDARAHTYLRPPSNGHHVSLCPTISLHDRQLPQAAIHRYMHHLLLEWETRLVTKTVFIVTDMDAWPRPFRNARFRQHFGPWVAVLQQTPAQPLFVPRPLSSPTMYAWTVVTNDALIKARRLAFAQFGVNLHHTDVHSQVAVLLWKDGRLIGTLVSTKTEDYGVVIQCTALVHTESNVRLVEMLQKLQEVTVQRDAGAATLHVFGRDRINARPEPVPVSYSALMHAGFHGTSAPYWKKREPRTLPQLDPRVYRVASIDIQKSLSEKGQRETEEAVMALVRLTRSGAANLINPPSWGYGRMVTFVHTIEHVESRCLIYLTVCNASTEDRRDMAGMGSSVTALQTSWTDGCFVADVQPPTTARHTAMNVHVMRMWQESSDALEFLINEQQGTREEGFIPLGFPFMWKQTPDAVPPLVDVDAELGEEKEPAAKRVRTSARIVYDPVVEQDDPVVNRATDIVPFQMEGATFVGGPILQPDLLTDLDTATTTNTNFLSEMVMDYATPQYSTTLHSPLKELGAFDILTGQLFYPLTQLARHVSQPKTAQWELVLLWRKTKNEVIKTPVGAIFVTRSPLPPPSIEYAFAVEHVSLRRGEHPSLLRAMFYRLERSAEQQPRMRSIVWTGVYHQDRSTSVFIAPWYAVETGFIATGGPWYRLRGARPLPLPPLLPGWSIQTFRLDRPATIEADIRLAQLDAAGATRARNGDFVSKHMYLNPRGIKQAALLVFSAAQDISTRLAHPPAAPRCMSVASLVVSPGLNHGAGGIAHLIEQWEQDVASDLCVLYASKQMTTRWMTQAVGYVPWGGPYYYDLPRPAEAQPLEEEEKKDDDDNEPDAKRVRTRARVCHDI